MKVILRQTIQPLIKKYGIEKQEVKEAIENVFDGNKQYIKELVIRLQSFSISKKETTKQ